MYYSSSLSCKETVTSVEMPFKMLGSPSCPRVLYVDQFGNKETNEKYFYVSSRVTDHLPSSTRGLCIVYDTKAK